MEKIVISQETSRRMSVMSCICACMIVAIHCTPNPPLGDWEWWVANLVGADGLCRIAVPWFFVASGFFLGGRFGEDGWYSKVVKKRVRTLLVPFVIWAIIGFAFNWFMWYCIQKAGYACGVQNPMDGGLLMGLIRVLGFDLNRMNIGPIWYLRMLFLLVVVSPIICWGIRKAGLLLPSVLFVVYGIYDTTIHFADFWEYMLSLRGFAYFTIGVAVRMGVLVQFRRSLWWCSGCMFLLMGVVALTINTWSRLIGVVCLENFSDFAMVVPLMYGVWRLTTYIRLPNCFISNAFAIYVQHGLFLKISIGFIAIMGLRSAMDESLVIAAVRWLAAVVFPIVVSVGLRRMVPRAASLIFGGR